MTTLRRGREFTRADLDVMPEDGRRYELIDGSLIVTPAPALRHQRAVGNFISCCAPPARPTSRYCWRRSTSY